MSDDGAKQQGGDNGARFWLIFPLALFAMMIVIFVVQASSMIGTDVSSVEVDGYAASQTFDEERAATIRFAERGYQLSLQPGASRAELVVAISGVDVAALSAVAVRCRRADSARYDTEVSWSQPAQPLTVTLPRAGRWRVEVVATDHDDEALRAGGHINL
ncbi:MAG: FixH family protein [Planctomycetota bacterium]|jgi:nitrogen fixation protein FixH